VRKDILTKSEYKKAKYLIYKLYLKNEFHKVRKRFLIKNRSETINHKKIRIPKHKVMPVLHELGKVDDVFEIIDLNKGDLESKKNYAGMITRCEQVEKIINKFYTFCERFSIKNNKFEDFDSYKLYSNYFDNKMSILNKLPFDYIENEVCQDEKIVEELFSSVNSIEEDLEYLNEKREVWNKLHNLIMSKDSISEPLAGRME
jgi:hypothetical protein